MRAAQEKAKESFKSYSACNHTALEVNRAVLEIRGDLARKEAELLDCQSQAMEAYELYRVSNAESAKWDSIIRGRYMELFLLGRSTQAIGRNSDTRIAPKLMAEELLLSETAVQTGTVDGATGTTSQSALADSADMARKLLRQKAEQEEKLRKAEAEKLRKAKEEKLRQAEEAEKLRKAREEEILRKAEIEKKAAEARAAAEEQQKQEAARVLAEHASNLEKQLTEVKLQWRMVTSQTNNGARRREVESAPGGANSNGVAGAEGLRDESKELARAEGPTIGESDVEILHRIGRTDIGTDAVSNNSQDFW